MQVEPRTHGLRVKHFTTVCHERPCQPLCTTTQRRWLTGELNDTDRSVDRFTSQRRWSLQTMLNAETTGPWLLPQNSIEKDTIQYQKETPIKIKTFVSKRTGILFSDRQKTAK